MPFKKFADFTPPPKNEVTIRANQCLFINNSALSGFNAQNAKYVNIYLDEEEKKIGIEFITSLPTNDYKAVKIAKEKTGITINLNSVLRYVGVARNEKKVIIPFDKVDNKLAFSLYPLMDRRSST